MTVIDLESVLASCQLAICEEALRILVEERKVSPSDALEAIDKATERLKKK